MSPRDSGLRHCLRREDRRKVQRTVLDADHRDLLLGDVTPGAKLRAPVTP